MSSHNYHKITPVRALKSYERDLLEYLLSVDFQGVSNLRKQIGLLFVEEECEECLSIGFAIDRLQSEMADVNKTIPVEAEGYDVDEMKLHFLLIIVDGFIDEMEIYREDLLQIKKLPPIQSLELLGFGT